MNERYGRGHWGLFLALALLALLFVVGVSVVLFWHFAPKPPSVYYYFPFFPFAILWAFLLIFFAFGILRWVFWGRGWGWGRRGYYGRRYGRYDQAHQILRERYARGEITKEQLDQMTRDLDEKD